MYLHYLLYDKNKAELDYDEYFKYHSAFSKSLMLDLKNKYFKYTLN